MPLLPGTQLGPYFAPGTAVTPSMLAFLLLERGRAEDAMAAVALQSQAEGALEQLIHKYGNTMAAQIAEVYAQRDDADGAFEWLERAYAERDSGLSEMRSSPRLRALHRDPRWAAFMRKMGFAP